MKSKQKKETGLDTPVRKHAISFAGEVSHVKSAFKHTVDVNNIMKKYIQTGQIPVLRPGEPRYGFAPSADFKSAMDVVTATNRVFGQLPAETRSKFDDNPAVLMAYLEQNPSAAELYDSGLLTDDQYLALGVDEKTPQNGTQAVSDDSGQSPEETGTDSH